MPTKKEGTIKKTVHEKKSDTVQKKLKHLEKELQEKNDKLLRAYADLRNYQKRMEKEIENAKEETKKKYLSELIDLYELLERASEDANPKEGINAILNNMKNLLEVEQISHINCIGKQFDHNHHHAISTIEKEDCEENEIVEEIKKGYMIEDRLLRPSQVVVAKKKE